MDIYSPAHSPNSKVLLIGNAASVLKYKFGKYIDDEFDIICRCNNFQLNTFEDYIGSRTEWIFARSCDDIQKYNPLDFQHIHFCVTYCPIMYGMEKVARMWKQHYGNQCTILDRHLCKKFGEDFGIDQPKKRLSVGAISIAYLIEQFDQVTIHGFFEDRLPNNNVIDKYWKAKPRDPQFHDFTTERKYIEELIDTGRVKILKDSGVPH